MPCIRSMLSKLTPPDKQGKLSKELLHIVYEGCVMSTNFYRGPQPNTILRLVPRLSTGNSINWLIHNSLPAESLGTRLAYNSFLCKSYYMYAISILGILFSGISVVESTCMLLASVIYNAIYPVTRQINPGFCFYLMAGCLIIPFALIM